MSCRQGHCDQCLWGPCQLPFPTYGFGGGCGTGSWGSPDSPSPASTPAGLTSQLLLSRDPSLIHTQRGLEGESYTPGGPSIHRGGQSRRAMAPVLL